MVLIGEGGLLWTLTNIIPRIVSCLQLSSQLMLIKLSCVDFYQERFLQVQFGGFETEYPSVVLNNSIPELSHGAPKLRLAETSPASILPGLVLLKHFLRKFSFSRLPGSIHYLSIRFFSSSSELCGKQTTLEG